MADTVDARNRLKDQLIRTGEGGEGRFREIGWPEALDRIADRPADIREKVGCQSMLPFKGSGSCRRRWAARTWSA